MILIPGIPARWAIRADAIQPPDLWRFMQSCSIDPMVTFLISTFNRRAVLLHTLEKLQEVDRRCGLITETIVVDNASRDGTADSVAAAFPEVQIIRQKRNTGACAKNAGLTKARGEFVIFLDDDSYPTADSIGRMIEHFFNDSKLGAAIFDVTLPDGSHESSAYPSVVIGCGTGFRRRALLEVGGLPTDFFMQAEEYDLSLRLLEASWTIQRFEDLHVRHLKTSTARIPTRTTRLDVRNNLLVATRYFPRHWVLPFAMDWTRRYWWMASARGPKHQIAFCRGLIEGVARSLLPNHRKPIGLAAFETFAMNVAIRRNLNRVVIEQNLQSIVLIDAGKNLLPFMLAAKACGLRVIAIADNKLARSGRKYHGVPIVCDADAANMIFDAAIVANISPAHAAQRTQTWKNTGRLVIDLFETPSSMALAA
jgi:GT2 family glycosyltransferase